MEKRQDSYGGESQEPQARSADVELMHVADACGGRWGRGEGGYSEGMLPSATKFCQLVTFDHARCCYFLTSVFPAIWEQMSVEGHNLTSESLRAHLKLGPAARTACPQGQIV